jgi:TetR/AcrR family transcriptional regulator, transcriptional repressor for nem operon
MPRPKSFEPADAVRAARDHFWRHGYEATTLSDLEAVTKLNRSSLYQAFGTKRQLFGLALENYLAEVAWPRLAPVEEPGAGPARVAGYFTGLAAALTAAPDIARRGCLIVNTITELGAHDAEARAFGAAYRNRIRNAFAAAFASTMPARAAARRADVLTATLIGILVTARLDPAEASALARASASDTTNGPNRRATGSLPA